MNISKRKSSETPSWTVRQQTVRPWGLWGWPGGAPLLSRPWCLGGTAPSCGRSGLCCQSCPVCLLYLRHIPWIFYPHHLTESSVWGSCLSQGLQVMFSFRWEPSESPRPAGALWSIATERYRPGPTTLCRVGHSLGSPHWQQAWASPRLPVGARRRHQELEGLSPQSHPFLVRVIHPVSDWELQPRKQLNCVL